MTKPAAGLAALETRLRQDLSWLELPAKNWVTPAWKTASPCWTWPSSAAAWPVWPRPPR